MDQVAKRGTPHAGNPHVRLVVALRMCLFGLSLATVAATQAIADDSVLIPSSYDEASGRWIGDVDALTNALANLTKGQTVTLSKGIYDVSPVTNAPLWSTETYMGAALLNVGAEGAKVAGETGNPKDVVIKAVNSEYRIFGLRGKNSSLHGVTVSGGNASAAHISYSNYGSGGGVVNPRWSRI